MEKKIAIRVENISSPPEKMRLMYEAVSQLLKEKKDISTVTVSEITTKAGIGKGTAYEYFSSKEELLAHALTYEYSVKFQMLARSAFEPEHFKDRCWRIMDWIKDNKEYNQMFTQLFKSNSYAEMVSIGALAPDGDAAAHAGCHAGEFGYEVYQYIYRLVDQFMEEAYREGAIRETDTGKRSLALLTSMVEYAFVIMGPSEWRYEHLQDGELRDFVYESLVRALN